MYSVVDISAGPRIQWWLVNECFNKFPVISTAGTRGSGRWMDGMNMTIDLSNVPDTYTLELETKVKRMLAKISIVSLSRPSLMKIPSASQFHIYLPWGLCAFSIVS